MMLCEHCRRNRWTTKWYAAFQKFLCDDCYSLRRLAAMSTIWIVVHTENNYIYCAFESEILATQFCDRHPQYHVEIRALHNSATD